MRNQFCTGLHFETEDTREPSYRKNSKSDLKKSDLKIGIRWNLLESIGFRWNLLESMGIR